MSALIGSARAAQLRHRVAERADVRGAAVGQRLHGAAR